MCNANANIIVMAMLVNNKVRIGTPTRYCQFRVVLENCPEIEAGIPISVKLALITTIKIAMLMKIARKSFIIIDPFIAVIFLYLSKTDIFQSKSLRSTLMNDTITEIPI